MQRVQVLPGEYSHGVSTRGRVRVTALISGIELRERAARRAPGAVAAGQAQMLGRGYKLAVTRKQWRSRDVTGVLAKGAVAITVLYSYGRVSNRTS